MSAALSPQAADRTLLIVAHTDDEVIAAGGYLAAAGEARSAVQIVIITNGDANRLSAAVISRRIRPTPDAFIREGVMRQQESLLALKRLGINSAQVAFLGFPDRGLAALGARHWATGAPYTSPYTGVSAPPYRGVFRPSARYTGEDLTKSLTDIITEFRPTVLLTHSTLDQHSDHQAVAAFTTRALDRAAQSGTARVKRFGFLIHADNFPRPLRYEPQAALGPPPALRERARWISFPLSPSTVVLKAEAMHCYRTQYQSPYLRLLLNGFIRSNELFIDEQGLDGVGD